MVAMEDFIRSASEGPPKRACRALGLRARDGDGGEVISCGDVAGWEVVEFSMLHFRSWFMLGSMVVVELS